MARSMVRWDPFRDLSSLRRDMDRLFDQALVGGGEAVAGHWTPSMDVLERADSYLITLDLPGMTSEDIEVTLDRNTLTVAGERTWREESKDESYHRIERRYGRFQRALSLPTAVEGDGIQASFTDGVLEIVVPKAEQARPRTIKIGEGARQLEA